MSTPTESLRSRLATTLDQFTPIERRLAEVVDGDPTIVAFDTVAELAQRVGASGPSIVRFAAKLGFDGYSELQRFARTDVAARLKRPTDRLRSATADDVWSSGREAAHRAIDDVFDQQQDDLVAIASAVADAAGRVWVVASEASSPVAALVTSNLRLIRPGVHHVTGSAAAVAATLIDASDDDVVIAIDVARYERAVTDITRDLAARGAAVVAITDSSLSPLAAIADHWCAVTIPAVGPFDSAVPIIAVAETLTAAVAERLHDDASNRLDRAESAWFDHAVFDTGHP